MPRRTHKARKLARSGTNARRDQRGRGCLDASCGCVDGCIDRAHQAIDAAGHKRQTCPARQGDQAQYQRILDDVLTVFLANKLLNELLHDEILLPCRVEYEPASTLVDSDRAWSEPPPGVGGVSPGARAVRCQPP